MIEEESKLEQCDQFTKPEEIDALRKYLRARIDEVNSRTELGSDAVKLSPSYGNEFDPDRENLPDAVLGVPQNSEQSRIDKVRDLEDPGIRPSIPTSVTNVSINNLTDTNAERLIGEIPSVSLGEGRDPIPFQDSNPDEIELGNYKETIKVDQEYSLDEEKIEIPGEGKNIVDLSNAREITHGEFKEQNELSKVLENLTEDQGNLKTISLGEGNEKIGKNFGGEVDSLSNFSSNLPGNTNNPDELPTNREKLLNNEHDVAGLSDFLSPLLPDEGRQFDASHENLPDAVLGVPQNSDQSRLDKVESLSKERIDTAGDFKDVSLSSTLEKTSGIYKTPDLGNTIENIPTNLGRREIGLENEALSIPQNNNQEGVLDHLSNSLPDAGIREESHNPNSDSISLLEELLSDNILSINQNPNYEDSYLDRDISKDGKVPEDPRYETVNSLREILSGAGLIPPSRNVNFKKIEELSETLPDGGTIPNNESKSIKDLEENLPEGGTIPNNESESVESLRENLPEGGTIPDSESENIEELRKILPEGGTIPNSESENIEELRENLPDGGRIPSSEFENIEELRENLPDGGRIPSSEFENVEDLRETLPEGGRIPDNEFEDIEDLRETLPDGGTIPNNTLDDVKDLNDDLPEGGKTPTSETEDIDDLRDSLPDGGRTPSNSRPEGDSEFENVEDLRENLPDGGKIPNSESEGIDDLRDSLPEGGKTPSSETEDIDDLRDSLPDGGKTPTNSRPEGDNEFESIEDLRDTLPDGGTTPINSRPENDSIPYENIDDLRDKLPEGGTTPINSRPSGDGEYEDVNDLVNSLPSGGETPLNVRPSNDESDYRDILDLDEFLSNGGITPDNDRPAGDTPYQYPILRDELPEDGDGNTPDNTRPDNDLESYKDIEDLEGFLTSTGSFIPLNVRPDNDEVEYRDIYDLPEELSEDGFFPSNDRPAGDTPYQYPILRDELPEDGDGSLPINSRPENDGQDYEEIEDLPDTIEKEGTVFHRKDGRMGRLEQQLLDNKVEFAFNRRGAGKKLQETPANSRPENDSIPFEDIEETVGLRDELPDGGTTPDNTRPSTDGEFESIDELNNRLASGGTIPSNTRPKNDEVPYEEIEDLPDTIEKEGTVLHRKDGRMGRLEQQLLDNKVEFTFNRRSQEKKLQTPPTNSRPNDDLTNSPINVEDFPNLTDLVDALKKRSKHDIDGYLKYLVNFAESKDLSSGWGQKLSSLLGELNTLKGGFNIDAYKNWEGRLYGAVIEYNGDIKDSARIGYSKLPNSLEAYANYNSYLRFAVDQARRGYNALLDESSFLKKADGVLGLKEEMLDQILIALVQQRDKLERVAKANRDRLPGDGGNGALQDLVRGDVSGAILNFSEKTIENLKSNAASTSTGFLDTNDPHNRPTKDKETYGWYSADYDESSNLKKKYSDRLKAATSAAFLGSSKSPNVFFQSKYLGGQGIRTTLYDLAEQDLDSDIIGDGKHPFGLGVKEFFKVIRRSPLITNPSKFTGIYDPEGKGKRGGTTYSLDVNNFWEIVVEPYIGKDNGFCSYLPSIEEINILNKYQHGVRTFYNRWMPITQFDLSRTRTTSKSVGLFGGEFTIPGGIEFTNELRMTVVDDSYKSWRRYFEKCSDVSVYSSRIHKKEFYGWLPTGTQKDAKTAMESDYADWKMVTPVDKTHFALAPYKNITFRIRIYIMTPQFSTINKYDLLGVMKEFSVERQGEIDPGSQDLEISFSIVGETNDDYLFTPAARTLKSSKETLNILEEERRDREEYIKSGKYKEDIEDYQRKKKIAENWYDNRHNNLYGGRNRASIFGGI